MKRILLHILALPLLMGAAGCQQQAKGPDAIPHLQGSNDRTTGLIEGAQVGIKTIREAIDPKWQALVDSVGGILAKAHESAEKTDEWIEIEAGQKAEVVKERDEDHAERVKLEISWGHRLQVWVTRLFWALVILVVLHIGLGFGALFVTGPIGTGMAIASHVINPLGWIGMVRDNLWFRMFGPAQKVQAIETNGIGHA